MTCPEHDLLVDYADGLLTAKEREPFERHLIACQCCRMEVAAERELLGRLRGAPSAPARESDFMAGLLSLSDLPTEPMPVRRPNRTGGSVATLNSHAPAQYVSARKPVGIAALAVVGCLSAAVVAIHVPAPDATQTRMPSRSSLSPQQVSPARVIGFQPSIVDAPKP
ncbi:anti-sigma factor [Yimella sp. cx-51]|uniref:anti-sigma factor family protein n=1 Tax=Yimella sp. cx-51 TaxID=2770551 RepID=UPI00165D74AD|nr:zf-HC2 domain-containing protein [Yimella sp. cx-51]MBC9956044.1 hypothetical protein [Yimella sp. cx-51]QTH37421.1 hypothetical protein J5M86_11120 [Yimella sp. cx-51]